MSPTPGRPLEATVREQWPRIVASLLRTTGDWELAEDCAQDAAERALRTWPRDGVPDNPGAWLTAVARRRAVDVLRRRATEARVLEEVAAQPRPEPGPPDAGGGFGDDRLRLLFTCCHPDLSLPDRVALTLRSVCGLSTREVARLLLLQEQTLTRRLHRTRERIVRSGLALAVPPPDALEERVDAVLAVVYLLFTEGYSPTEGAGLRDELADEALALARLATWLLPGHGEAHALRALLLLQHARRPARLDSAGGLVPLEEQDRTLWDRPLVAAGLASLRLAREAPDAVDAAGHATVGPYRVQAEIASLHSTATTPGAVDWAAVVAWYDALFDATHSPVVALNRVVAVSRRDGPEAGLAALDAAAFDVASLAEEPAVRADLLHRAGRPAEASEAYARALSLARTDAVRLHLQRRLAEVRPPIDAAGTD